MIFKPFQINVKLDSLSAADIHSELLSSGISAVYDEDGIGIDAKHTVPSNIQSVPTMRIVISKGGFQIKSVNGVTLVFRGDVNLAQCFQNEMPGFIYSSFDQELNVGVGLVSFLKYMLIVTIKQRSSILRKDKLEDV